MGNTASCLAGFVAVPLSGLLFQQTGSWDAVFLLFAGHYVAGALIFWLLASDTPIVDFDPLIEDVVK